MLGKPSNDCTDSILCPTNFPNTAKYDPDASEPFNLRRIELLKRG
jgi:hypothetical protein